jgi:hypothetical protein
MDCGKKTGGGSKEKEKMNILQRFKRNPSKIKYLRTRLKHT